MRCGGAPPALHRRSCELVIESRGNRSPYLRYIKTFLITGPIMAVAAHYMTSEPMPWWPDTLIFGGFMGAMAAFVLMRFVFARRAVGHLAGAGRAFVGKARR